MEEDLLVAYSGLVFGPVAAPFSKEDARPYALIINNSEDELKYLHSMLSQEQCRVSAFNNIADAIAHLQQGLKPDIALISSKTEELNGTPALTLFREVCPTVPVIAILCSYDLRSIIEAMKLGAVDVLIQPFDQTELKSSVERYAALAIVKRRKHIVEIPLTPATSFVMCSEQMKTIASQCDLMADTDLPVLIMGESGTGKEILAHYIHQKSACANAPFLKVNCAAMPGDLLESELLGYEQGAFTGAVKAKPGKFELCDHGTIFLDEIGEMPPALQAKLLQVLQDGTFSRLGGRSTIKVNVRVIAATNVDIKAAIRERRFREDLYYRINGFSIYLPPLRQRREEIPVLIRYFMQKIMEKYACPPVNITERLLNACMRYHWPGNLRELENFVKRYMILGSEQTMLAELSSNQLPSAQSVGDHDAGIPTGGLKKLLSNVKGQAEARVISATLRRNHWKRKQTAAELKISYKALLYKMRQHEIVAPQAEPVH